jgi:prephenate dehydrogenase
MKVETISILGLNRMGAAIALAVQGSPLAVTVVGYDADREVAQAAKAELGAVDKVEWNLVAAARQADILILTIPEGERPSALAAISTELQEHTLLLDMGGSRQAGQKWAAAELRKGHYVAAAPLLGADWLGDGRTAIRFATPEMFQKSAFCLMPAADADPQAVETAVNFGILLGSLPFFLDAAEYDALTQGMETLPGLTALALYRALASAPGRQDRLRVAGMSFTLATAPLANSEATIASALANPQAAAHWLDLLIDELSAIRGRLQAGEGELLQAIAAETDLEREKWLRERQKNEWDERKMPRAQQRTLNEHIFGGWIAGRQDDDDA